VELYSLDDGFRLKHPIDGFDSIVWTDRYSAEGDFVLTLPATPDNIDKLPLNTFLGTDVSRDVMLIESHDIEGPKLTVSGTSMVGFLKNRILRDTWWNGAKSWVMAGAPGLILGEIVRQMCMSGIDYTMEDGYVVDGTDGAKEVITGLVLGTTAPGTSVEIAVPYGDVYSVIKELADSYSLGFAMYPSYVSDTTFALTFTTYAGRDLTGNQTTYPVVRFEPALDSMVNMKDLRSVAGYKNVCYAWPPEEVTANLYLVGKAYAYPEAANLTNWQRRSMMIRVTDTGSYSAATDPDGSKLKALLSARAKDALANNNYVRMVDGELVPQTGFVYGSDYFLGDIVELRAPTGASDRARVTEYIHSQDKLGYKAYPTLSVVDA
jgi:hypothetical protein